LQFRPSPRQREGDEVARLRRFEAGIILRQPPGCLRLATEIADDLEAAFEQFTKIGAPRGGSKALTTGLSI
jgi:hypothetical protein